MTGHPEADRSAGDYYHSREVDTTLQKIPRLGRWRLCTYTMVCLGMNVTGAWQMLAVVFIAGEPESFGCEDHPELNGVCEGDSHNITCPTKRHYYSHHMGETIVTSFDLVCERSSWLMTTQTVFGVGSMIGALVFPMVSDRHGRRPVHIVCHGFLFVLGVSLSLSNDIVTYTVLRFLLGAVREGVVLTGIVIMVEMFPAIDRTVAGITVNFFWSLSHALLALMAYGLRHWRHLQVTLTIPGILTLAYLWLLPESIPWLIAQGRIEDVDKVMERAARIDGIGSGNTSFLSSKGSEKPKEKKVGEKDGTIQERTEEPKDESIEMKEAVEKTEPEVNNEHPVLEKATIVDLSEGCLCVGFTGNEKTESYNIIDMFKTPKPLIYSSLMCFLWFVDMLLYRGLSLGPTNLPGDPFFVFFINGLLEIPAFGLTLVLLQIFGRRWPLALFHAVAGFSLIGTLHKQNGSSGGQELAFALLAKFAVCSSIATIFLYATEIHVTTLRTTGLGLASFFGRLGIIVAPLIPSSDKNGSTRSLFILALLSLLTVPAGVALPETGEKALPASLDEVDKWQDGISSTLQTCRRRLTDLCEVESYGSEAGEALKEDKREPLNTVS